MPEDKTPVENETAVEKAAGESPGAGTAPKSTTPPAVALGFVIIALLGVLLAVSYRGFTGKIAAGSPELTELQAEADALRDQLNRERLAMGLRPLEGGSEPIEDIAARLKKDADTMVALAGSFRSLLAEKDSELSAKNAELLSSEQSRQSLAAESVRLQAELQRALVNGSEVDLLRRDLAAMKAQRDALAAEIAALRQELATKGQGVSAEEFADLKRRLDEAQRARDFFEAKVKQLEGEVSKAKLFASSENELLPAAVELFRSLRQLEGRPDSEISSAYSSLGAKLGANVLRTLNFATGSSTLTPADEDAIRNLVSEIPDGDLLLAIGYASKTGNVDGNRTLSSDRATAAAELYSSIKRPTQLVQAVYLGQTDRFSSRIPERNQIVEIWRIRKK
jgi:outer membrane protein OmpA-like peptidoglycan-associated protein